MKDWDILISELIKFRDERDWKQFHNPKDLSLAISIESSELNELFLWKNPEEADPQKVKEELADIVSYILLLSDYYDFNLQQIVLEKISQNAQKYPVEKSKGNSKKYNQF